MKEPSPPPSEEDTSRLIQKARSVSKELLYITAPSNLLTEPALTLFSELLTLQVWKVVESLSDDWLNQTLITFLVQKEPQIEEEAAKQQERDAGDSSPNFKAAIRTCLDGPPELIDSLLIEIDQYLNSKHASPQPEFDNASVEVLAAVLARKNEELAEAFSLFLDGLPQSNKIHSQSLVRLYGQLESFRKVVEMTEPDLPTWRSDSLSVLSRIYDALSAEMTTSLKSSFFRCLTPIMSSGIHPDALAPLQDWILQTLHHEYFVPFQVEKQAPVPSPVSPSPASSFRSPSPSPSRPSIEDSRTSLESAESDQSFALPTFSISVTDISEPSAYEKNTIKNKRDLAFLVAVEANGPTPGYILQRSFPEIEKMDEQLHKALPAAGTADFPRALLPSTQFRTSDDICHQLEAYFKHLLSEERYAISAPVQKFFEKERAGPSQPALTLWDLGKGASKATKAIAKTGETATRGVSRGFIQVGTGFTQVGSGISQGFSQGFSQVGSVFTGLKPPPFARKPSSASALSSASAAIDSLIMATEEELNLEPAMSPDEMREGSSEIPQQANQEEWTDFEARAPETPREPDLEEPETPRPDGMQPRPPTLALQTDSISPANGNLEPSSLLPTSDAPTQPTGQDSELNAQDFEHILYAGLSVLEEAFLLSNEQWTLKRGIFRIIETVVRTSYASYIKALFASIVKTADAPTFARKIEDLTNSFWPNGVWYATNHAPIVRSEGEVEATRLEARRLLIAQAPDGLKLTLGAKGVSFDGFTRDADLL